MKLYYCSVGNHLWHYDNNENAIPLFYKNLEDATDSEVEKSRDEYCGCNDGFVDPQAHKLNIQRKELLNNDRK